MDGFHFSRVLPWHFSLVFWGLDSTVSQDTISVVFVGSEFALVFQDRDLVGFLLDRIRLIFLDLDIRFFVRSDLVFLD